VQQAAAQEQPQQEPKPAYHPQPQTPPYQPQPQGTSYQPQPYTTAYHPQPQAPAYKPQPAPAYNSNTYGGADPREKVYGVGGWLLTYLVMMIPIVNIVMIFVWAFGSKANKNKKNWAIASLIVAAIGIVLSIILSATIASIFNSLLNQFGTDFGNGGLYFPGN